MEIRYGQIIGWGAYVPKTVVTNHELEQKLDTSDEWIVQRTGIRERRFASPGETTASMSLKASERALASARLASADIDLIIVATSTPDYLAPTVASEVQHMLGAVDVPAMQLVTGCTGFVYALSTAYQFIQTGAYAKILIVGVELLSPFLDWGDRTTAVLFGDAAAAVVLQATAKPCGLKGFNLGSDGSGGKHILFPADRAGNPINFARDQLDGGYIQFNGREVFKFAARVLGKACRDALAQADMTFDDIDWIIPHQANLRIIQAAAREMGLPLGRFYLNIEKYANTSAASIPLALTEGLEAGIIKPDDRVLFVAFGAGLTWGAAVYELGPRVRPVSAADALVKVGVAPLAHAAD